MTVLPPATSPATRRVNSLIRYNNIVRVFHALRDQPHSSQRDLGHITGLDKATVSAVIGELLERGLVAPSAQPRPRRVGRPETGLVISPDAGVLIGARLEPASLRIVCTTLAGTPVGHRQIEGSRDIHRALALLAQAVRDELATLNLTMDQVRGIGVGIPGLIDRDGRLAVAPNLGWHNVPIRALLETALGDRISADNDTKAAAIAEHLFGACRNHDEFFYITGHSGVGGALFMDGRLRRGAGGFAGEFGHIRVVPDGLPCHCGGRGCVETVASEQAILTRLADTGLTLPDIRAVAALARAGDTTVCRVLDQVGAVLGLALAHVLNLLNPAAVVLGGNLAVVGDAILPALHRALAHHTLPPILAGTTVLLSPWAEDAVPMGGVALALDRFLAPPNWPAPRDRPQAGPLAAALPLNQ